MQPQATGHRQTAPRGPEETPGPPTCPLPSGLWSIAGLGHLCVASKLSAGPGCPRRPPSSWACSSGWGWGWRRGGRRRGGASTWFRETPASDNVPSSLPLEGEAVPFLCWVPESAWPQGPVDPTALRFGPKGICESGTFPWETTRGNDADSSNYDLCPECHCTNAAHVGPCRLEASVTRTSQTRKLRLREAEKPVQGHDPTDRSRPAFPRGAHENADPRPILVPRIRSSGKG